MKKIDLGQTIGILANVGVIAGIVFLGYELRQNNASIEAQIRGTRHIVRRDDFLLPLQNREFAETLIKHRHGEQLTEYETLILNRSIMANLLNLRFVFNEFRQGRILEENIPIDSWRKSFENRSLADVGYWPNARAFWEENKTEEFDPAFVEWMDENIVDPR
jgi:hypothetical protein